MSAPAPVIPSTSGIAALDILHTLEEMVGNEAILRARANCPLEIQRELDAITALSWVPMTVMGVIIDEIARSAQLEPEAMLDRAVRRSIERTFKTVWRMFLRVTSTPSNRTTDTARPSGRRCPGHHLFAAATA